MIHTTIQEIIVATLGDTAIEQANEQYIQIAPEKLPAVCQLLHTHEACYFDMLSCLTGLDNGTTQQTMEVVYHLYSIPYEHKLTLKVVVPRENPVVPSVSHLWKTADWHEREAFDLLGIVFSNHPNLRRILLPEDWEGHPLRKDYQAQEYYHGIQVKY